MKITINILYLLPAVKTLVIKDVTYFVEKQGIGRVVQNINVSRNRHLLDLQFRSFFNGAFDGYLMELARRNVAHDSKV